MRHFKISHLRQENAHYIRWAQKGTLAVLDQGIFSGSNFVVSVLLARWMSEDDYGAFAYGFSLYLFISGFYNVLLLEPLSIFGLAKHKQHLESYVSRQLALHTVAAFIIGLILFLIAVVNLALNTNSRLAPVLLGLSLGHGASLLFWLVRRSYYVEQRNGKALWGTIIYSGIVFSGVIVFHSLDILSPFIAFVWFGIAALIASSIMLLYTRNRSRSNALNSISFREVARENWQYGKWLTASALLNWLSGNAYYILAGTLLTLNEVAELKALQNLTMPSIQVITAINLLFLPWASQRYADNGIKTLKRDILSLMLFSTGVTSMFFAVLIVFRGSIFDLLYANKYAEGQQFLFHMGLFSTILALKSAWSISLKIREKTTLVSFVDVLGAIFTVTVGIVLVDNFGLLGAVLGLVISSAASVIMLMLIEMSLNRQHQNSISIETGLS